MYKTIEFSCHYGNSNELLQFIDLKCAKYLFVVFFSLVLAYFSSIEISCTQIESSIWWDNKSTLIGKKDTIYIKLL